MSIDFSAMLPILVVVISLCAAVFMDGVNGAGSRLEKYISESVLQPKRQADQPSMNMVRIEILPGDRLKSSDLRARDERERATTVG